MSGPLAAADTGTLEPPRVVVTRPELPGHGLTRLTDQADVVCWDSKSPPSREALTDLLSGAAGLLCLNTERVDAALLDAAPHLRVVSNLAVGTDNLDIPALTARGIPAGNTPGVLTETTADLAWALILACARRIVESDRYVRAGKWTGVNFDTMLGVDVHGATLGIVGKIGRAVAQRARGFQMRVVHSSRRPESDEFSSWRPLDDLLRDADIVSLHPPLTPDTRGLIGARELALMKPTAILVNTARGPIVDQSALHDALSSGRLFAAGLDVMVVEPVPSTEALFSLPNCIMLPHIGSATLATRARMVDLAVDNILAGLAGVRLPHCVNPDVYAE